MAFHVPFLFADGDAVGQYLYQGAVAYNGETRRAGLYGHVAQLVEANCSKQFKV